MNYSAVGDASLAGCPGKNNLTADIPGSRMRPQSGGYSMHSNKQSGKGLYVWALVAWMILCGAGRVAAQEVTASITGTVRDPSGAAVPGARVTITNTDRGAVVRTTTTGAAGDFSAPLLPIGHYEVTVEAQGFRLARVTGIELHVHEVRTVDVTLEVGSVQQTVTVTATPLQVELESATASHVIVGTQVRELPLNTRNYEQLVALMPGVSSGNPDQLYIGLTNPLTGGTNVISYSVNGNRTSANNWTIDGADNVDRGSNLTLLTYPSVDAIAEFRVLRGLYNPEYGRAGGAIISVVTRSGTSAFHGTVYEFFRNDVLNANNFFNNANRIARPPLRYNNFGYTIGGPVYIPGVYNTKKNKTFFFFSEEFRRVITYGTASAIVPTSNEKQGLFAHPVCVAFSGPNGTGSCTATSTQVTNISSVAQAYLKDIWSKIPNPQDPVTHLLFTPLRNKFDFREEIARIDHTFNARWSIFGRYMHDSIPTTEPGGLFTGLGLPNVATTDTNAPGYSWLVQLTGQLSPSLINETGYMFSYGAILSNPVGLINPANSPDIHVNLPFVSTLARVPSISIAGGTGIAGFGPYHDYNRNHTFFDNISKIYNRHTFKAGFVYHHYEKTENAAGGNAGSFSFTQTGKPAGTSNFEQAWDNFLQGFASNFSQASLDITPDIMDNQWELFGQDTFQWRPNVTLTYGVRVSFFQQPTDANGLLTNFDPLLWNPARAPQIDSNGNVIPGTGDPLNGVIINGQNSPYGQKVANEDYRNIAPRIGIAWDPLGDGRTAVRAGYGIFYDSSLFGIYEQNIFSNPPFVQSISIDNTLLDNPTAGNPRISTAPVALRATPLPYHTPYVQNWSLDVQRQFGAGLVVDVGYYGNKGTHLLGIIDINEVPPGLAASLGLPTITRTNTARLLNPLRPYRGYNAINTISTRFDSNYNSLQVSVQKRFSQGSLVEANYTWSHCLTDNQTDRSTAPQNSYNLAAEYGPCQLDRRHIFTMDYVYALPWLRDQRGVLGHVVGGWELTGIVTAETGLPITVFTASNVDPGGLGYLGPSAASGRPDRVGDPNSNAPHQVTQWFNTAAFADVPAGANRPGNAPRGAVIGPGLVSWDFGAFKNIRVTERVGLQFRAELFNVLNHTNFLGVGATLGTSTFGRILSAHDPRIAQLALKLNW